MKINHWNKTNSTKREIMSQIKNIQSLRSGDIFKAEILDIRQKELLLQLLSDGSKINARVNGQLDYTIGQFIYFKVLSSSEQQIVIEPVFSHAESQRDDLILNALSEAQVSNTERNRNIVKTLIKNKLPIDKSHIQEFIQQLDSQEPIHVQKLIFLIKNHIDISKTNIQQLDGYLDHSVGLKNQIEDMITAITTIKDPVIKEQVTQAILDKPILHESSEIEAVFRQVIHENEEILKELKMDIQNKHYSSEEIKKIVFEFLSKEPVGVKLLEFIQKEDNLFKIFLETIRNQENMFLERYDQVKEKTKSSILRQELLKPFFMDPKDLAEPRTLNEYYNILHSKIHELEQIIGASTDAASETFHKSLDNIRQNISFLNQLSQFDNYIQIPLKVNDFMTQGDLYILKNKSKKKQKETKTLTALLALDLRNLGHFEALIAKTNNMVTCQFRVENKGTEELLKAKINLFQSKLYSLGYILQNVSYILSNERFNVLQFDELHEDIQEDMKRYSFDMRV